MNTTNAIEQGKKWAAAVDAARPSAKKAQVQANPMIELAQLGAITLGIRSELKDATKSPFRSGVYAALALVNAHANLVAQQNAQAQLATAKNSAVSNNSHPAISDPDLQKTNEYFDTVYGMNKPSSPHSSSSMGDNGVVDWKHAAAQLQKQVIDLQGELHNQEQKVADLTLRNKELAAIKRSYTTTDFTVDSRRQPGAAFPSFRLRNIVTGIATVWSPTHTSHFLDGFVAITPNATSPNRIVPIAEAIPVVASDLVTLTTVIDSH